MVTYQARLRAELAAGREQAREIRLAWQRRLVRNRRVLALLLTLVVTLSVGPAARRPTETPPAAAAVADPATAATKATPRKTVALTFDDGPSRFTPQVLAVLRRHGVKATFCLVGDQAIRHRLTAKLIVRDGHQVCNHTRTHPNLRRLSSAKARKQIADAQVQITSAAGQRPTLFRFPYGAGSARLRAIVKQAGLRNLTWNVDTKDWRKPAPKIIAGRATGHRRTFAVVLMHDGGGNRSNTVAALETMITTLKRQGYTFVLP
ncbi:MAG TPA: polysaccharide deacetylase family protein [Actinoplanes sp.]|nr:polysaccharide deacetylase family protein [Actinoplanes sp.]